MIHSILYSRLISMFEFQKKKRIRKIIHSPYFLVIFFILFFSVLKGTYGVYMKDKMSFEKLNIEKIENKKLLERKNNLTNSIDYLKTDQGIESEIRSKFRAVKEGESVTVIVDRKNETNNTATTTEKKSWYSWFH